MPIDVNSPTLHDDEFALIKIVRGLPATRVAQVIDFARFLEAQLLNDELLAGEDLEEIEADNEEWDALVNSEESQLLLQRMAGEALAEYKANRTKEMTFDDKGRIKPE